MKKKEREIAEKRMRDRERGRHYWSKEARFAISVDVALGTTLCSAGRREKKRGRKQQNGEEERKLLFAFLNFLF